MLQMLNVYRILAKEHAVVDRRERDMKYQFRKHGF